MGEMVPLLLLVDLAWDAEDDEEDGVEEAVAPALSAPRVTELQLDPLSEEPEEEEEEEAFL